jgi:transposase
MLSELSHLDERIKAYDQHIEQAAKQDTQARQLMQLSGVGSITASAIVATVGKGHDFSCGRQFCAWLGLVPGQYSSGGKQRLGRITKAGDAYLRTLLIRGAKAVLVAAKTKTAKTDPVSRWAIQIQARRGYWKAVVAVAAKNARMCWAMLQRGEEFKMPA